MQRSCGGRFFGSDATEAEKLSDAPRLDRCRRAPSDDGSTDAQYHGWGGKSCIWVCFVPEGKDSVSFYSHECRGGKFHHSSLSKGGKVVGAGEWIVEDGKLKKVSANSGHYQPTMDYLYNAVGGRYWLHKTR